jgi:hypothetical protein
VAGWQTFLTTFFDRINDGRSVSLSVELPMRNLARIPHHHLYKNKIRQQILRKEIKNLKRETDRPGENRNFKAPLVNTPSSFFSYISQAG